MKPKPNFAEFTPNSPSNLIPEALFESQLFGHRKGAFTGADHDHSGYVGAAQDGTLFLDEIGKLPLAQQPKLLRFLQDGSYLPVGETVERASSVWSIAATNRDLRRLVQENSFLEDLYHRLNVMTIDLPPLRERREDIPLLAASFLQKFAEKFKVPVKQLSEEAENILQRHHWPGNVRELEHLMMKVTVLVEGEVVLPQHLPAEIGDTEKAIVHEKEQLSALHDVERSHILQMLMETGFNLSQTAKRLQIDRKTLYRKMAKYHLNSEAFRRK
jgi:two-component system response regulator HydG